MNDPEPNLLCITYAYRFGSGEFILMMRPRGASEGSITRITDNAGTNIIIVH